MVLTALLGVVTLVVMSRTDEPENTWFDRIVRLAAAAPALTALATILLLRQLRARGELRALTLSGAHPFRQSLGFALAGAGTGIFVAAAILPSPSLRALLPVVSTSPWRASSHGFTAATLGLFLEHPGGSVQYIQTSTTVAHTPLRTTIVLALMLASILAPWWASQPGSSREKWGIGVLSVVGVIVAFHAIALGGSETLLLFPCALLLLHILIRGDM